MTVTRTSEAMSIIEEIKRDVRHEDDCSLEMDADARCTCSYRRKIAWLERLEEPTEEMKECGIQAGVDWTDNEATEDVSVAYIFKAMITAAEEAE